MTYTWFDRIERRVKTSIDIMISQLFKSLPKCRYVGVITKSLHFHIWLWNLNFS